MVLWCFNVNEMYELAWNIDHSIWFVISYKRCQFTNLVCGDTLILINISIGFYYKTQYIAGFHLHVDFDENDHVALVCIYYEWWILHFNVQSNSWHIFTITNKWKYISMQPANIIFFVEIASAPSLLDLYALVQWYVIQ